MRRVVKVGGSLLTRNTLVADFTHWLGRQSPAQTLIIFGGGELVDCVRRLDRLRPGDSARVHWRCVDLLQVTFEVASEWFSDLARIDAPCRLNEELDQFDSGEGAILVSVRSFYDPHSRPDLPVDWSTTTDSIAAALALQTDAQELVLLKSCEVDGDCDPTNLAERGIVDDAFPTIARGFKTIRIEKLATCDTGQA